jgi:flagellar biosynthesis/type III secretory pathway M-ring protein FliF/YscJ
LAAAGLVFWYRRPARRGKPPAPPALVEAEKQLAERAEAQRQAEEAMMLELKMPQVTSNKALVLKKVLAEAAKKDPATTAQLLRTWLHEDED